LQKGHLAVACAPTPGKDLLFITGPAIFWVAASKAAGARGIIFGAAPAIFCIALSRGLPVLGHINSPPECVCPQWGQEIFAGFLDAAIKILPVNLSIFEISLPVPSFLHATGGL